MKAKRYSILIAVLMSVFVLLLSGCMKQKTASEDAYKLPLGDSGYINEIDFSFYDCKGYSTNAKGATDKWINYKYVEEGKAYTLEIEFGLIGEEFNGKSVKLLVGSYNENNEFVAVAESDYIIISSTEYTSATLNFTAPSTFHTKAKLVFGTSVDEAYYKSINEGAKNKDVNKYRNQFRGSSFVIRSLDVRNDADEVNSILYDTVVKDSADNPGTYEPTGSYVGRTNEDLTYYNTATVSWNETAKTLTITLNLKKGPWQWIVAQLGSLLGLFTKWLGGAYWAALILFTVLLRTAAWPIYAKSNSTSARMSAIQPEIQKINEKYAGKTDQNSKMKQQMETRELMKKNHVIMLGCLLPFLQMPIFIAVYQVAQRFPLTPRYVIGTNFDFLWTNFGANYGVVTGDWILAILVGITMIASQEISIYMSKRIAAKKRNFYTAKNQQSNTQMRIMMLVMTVMMVVFAIRSAGLAFYWIIGNTYQIAQTFISKLQEAKQADKELQKSGKPAGR